MQFGRITTDIAINGETGFVINAESRCEVGIDVVAAFPCPAPIVETP